MKKTSLIILAFAAALFLTVPASAQQRAATGDAAKGKELYLTYSCYSCHGFDGHGGSGARLSSMKMLQPVFTAYVRNPARMPSYSTKVLSDAQLRDIYAYIKSIPDSPPVKNIPLLNSLLTGN